MAGQGFDFFAATSRHKRVTAYQPEHTLAFYVQPHSKWLIDSCGSVSRLRALPASPVSALQSAASNTFFDSLPRHLGATVNFDMNFFYYYRVTEDSGRYLRNNKKYRKGIRS
jgi:hypothetical protein